MANGHPSTTYAVAVEAARVLARTAIRDIQAADELTILLAADANADSPDHAAAASGNGDWPLTEAWTGPGIPLGIARAVEAARADVP